VRLRGDVLEARVPFRHRRRHDRVLGRGHAGLVEEDARALQATVRLDRVAALRVDLRAQTRERDEVRVHSASADDVTTGRWQRHSADSCEHGACEQDARADARGHPGGQLARLHFGRVDAQPVRPDPFVPDAERAHQVEQRLHVPDLGHVVQDDRLVREQRGRDHGQGCVLIAGGPDLPVQGDPALDDEFRH
jgi:hypothetical protein